MIKNTIKQVSMDNPLHKAISDITAIIEKYTEQIDLLDIIDIVDNLRVLAEIAESGVQNKTNVA